MVWGIGNLFITGLKVYNFFLISKNRKLNRSGYDEKTRRESNAEMLGSLNDLLKSRLDSWFVSPCLAEAERWEN